MCHTSDRERFTNKQWAGKAHTRKCRDCTLHHAPGVQPKKVVPADGVSQAADDVAAEGMARKREGEREGMKAAGMAAEGTGRMPIASMPQPPAPVASEQRQKTEAVMGPIVRREVMAAKCASSSEYGMLDAYVEEECMVCLESW